MKLLLLLALATVGHCALLGSKKCTYGPSYWCSHIHHAKECNAMQHCMTTVWKNQRPGMTGSTETCFDTIKVIDAVRHSSESRLLEQMAVGCTGLPVEKRSLCKELMSHDQNEVHMLLKSDLPSMQVAAALGLCHSFPDAVPHAPEAAKSEQVSSDSCTDCLNFFRDILNMTYNSEKQFETELWKMCAELPVLKSECKKLVSQYADMIFSMTKQGLNPNDMCAWLNMCGRQTHADFLKSMKSIMAKRQGAGMECSLCQNLAKDIQNALRDPTVQNEVLDFLDNTVCPLLPGDLASQCKTYVAQYGHLVFQILVAELDPTTICQTLGFCNATKAESDKMTAIPLGSPIGTVHILAPEKKEKTDNAPECALCEFAMRELKQLISKNATEAEIEQALKKVCSLLPSTLQQECNQFVDMYGPTVIQLLLQDLDPQTICSKLGLCSSQTHLKVKVTKPVKGPEACLVCETVFGYVKSAINDPNDQRVIVQIVEEVCNYVPAGIKTECQSLIETYFPAIISLLNNYDDPEKICTALGLCSSTNQPLLFQPMVDLQPAKPHLLGSNKCLYGPSYWCASVENAKECNVLEHCVKHYNMKVEN